MALLFFRARVAQQMPNALDVDQASLPSSVKTPAAPSYSARMQHINSHIPQSLVASAEGQDEEGL